MKNIFKPFGIIAIITIIGFSVFAPAKVYAQEYDSESDFQIDWDPNVKGGVIITKYIGNKTVVNIPPKIKDNPVTGIGNSAFIGVLNDNYTKAGYITTVTIPDGVKSIGVNAFRDCSNLTSINIPNGITIIRNGAFMGCKFTSVTIPDSVTTIEDQAFSQSGLTSIIIPKNVTSIGALAFYCFKLTSVTFQGNIPANKFGGSGWSVFQGDLDKIYLARNGGIGTYTRFDNGETWKKK